MVNFIKKFFKNFEGRRGEKGEQSLFEYVSLFREAAATLSNIKQQIILPNV